MDINGLLKQILYFSDPNECKWFKPRPKIGYVGVKLKETNAFQRIPGTFTT